MTRMKGDPAYILDRERFDAFETELFALCEKYGWAIRDNTLIERTGINGATPQWEVEFFQKRSAPLLVSSEKMQEGRDWR